MSAPWTDTFYDDVFARWWMAARPRAALEAAADLIERALELPRPARIFDQCCGIGQLALVLAARGHEVFGVDSSARYVAAARYLAERDGRSACFVAADAASTVAPEPCDAAVSWHTSFGAGVDAAEDNRWLRCVHASLKAGGSLLLDVGNRARVEARFTPSLVTTLGGEGGEVRLARDCDFDRATGVMRQLWRFTLPDGSTRERASVMRIYHRDELARMLEAQGLIPTRWFGGVSGEPLTDDSERCIVVARRP